MRYSSCVICGTAVIESGNGRNATAEKRRCIDCIQAANYRNCDQCGKRFYRNRAEGRFCGRPCWYAWKRDNAEDPKMQMAKKGQTRRARKREAFVEYVDHQRVFARDGWTCWICEGPVIPGHPRWAPSVDHVMPLSLGGLHSYANVRTAHMLCNHIKGSRYWPPVPLDPILRPLYPQEEYAA